MKITEARIKQIIKEELEAVMQEIDNPGTSVVALEDLITKAMTILQGREGTVEQLVSGGMGVEEIDTLVNNQQADVRADGNILIHPEIQGHNYEG